jgi:hypothetical protein
MILPNSKDKAWSQYKHLHDFGDWKEANKNLRFHGSWVLVWQDGDWSAADVSRRLAYRESWREDAELKARNSNKTSAELECEKIAAFELWAHLAK